MSSAVRVAHESLRVTAVPPSFWHGSGTSFMGSATIMLGLLCKLLLTETGRQPLPAQQHAEAARSQDAVLDQASSQR
jgi:hypothetical protein